MLGNNIDPQFMSQLDHVQNFNGVIELTDDVAQTVVGGKTTQVNQKGQKKIKSFFKKYFKLAKGF